ncbi:B12-binding domain-containing protein [Palleronia rufa]|uniref:cobalamin B12-binding domain-containing protein n=1 Tax=Palleronia rufa TaxID=1530186 RepID=UPI00068EC960|nr:cobalamin B12-binding domain-containing protein [Palleronia rufa]
MGSSGSSGKSRTRSSETGVVDLATCALDLLASRRKDHAQDSWAEALQSAVTSPDPTEKDTLLRSMLKAGISPERICDHYIPAVARRMGDDWCRDSMSFADVTIGSARLQALLRDASLQGGGAPMQGAENLAVIVLADEYHTLGAMVLTGQLRRLGASVRLALGRPEAEIRRLVGDGGFDAILISVALAECYREVNRIIRELRDMTGGRVPIVAGGSILDLGAESARTLTGADHIAGTAAEALQLTGSGAVAGPDR